jgi:hypothetical protein
MINRKLSNRKGGSAVKYKSHTFKRKRRKGGKLRKENQKTYSPQRSIILYDMFF